MKKILSILALLFCCVGNALAGIDYIGQALDLSQLSNGSSTEVVIRAAGNDANDASFGFVYKSSNRFVIDTNTKTKASLAAKGNEYTFTLFKTAEGTYRLQEHVANMYLPGFTTGTNGFTSSNNDHTYSVNEYANASKTLDNARCYSLTYTADGGFTLLKNNNEFQVNNGKPTLYLQFFRYASTDKYINFPALYSEEAISTLRASLSSAQYDGEADAAIEALNSCANNKVIAIKSTTTAYSNQSEEYLYVESNDAKTAASPANKESEYFLVEYASNSSYRLKSWANNQYLAPTTGKSTTVDPDKTQAEAGLYAFLWNTSGSAGSHVVLACQNATGNEAATYYALHRNGSHNLVTWEVTSAASFWSLEEAEFTVTYSYVDSQTDAVLKTVPHTLHYGEPLPAADESIDNYAILTRLEGNVEGTRTYTIKCLNLAGEDQADAEKPHSVQLTYRLMGPDGVVWHTETVNATNEAAYPELSSLPEGVSVEYPTGNLITMKQAVTVDVACTSSFNFKFADSFEHIKSWYNVAIHKDDKYLFNYNESDTYMTLSEKTGATDKYLFAFVGNPFDGYKIYNRAAGSSKVLSAPNPTVGNSVGKDTGEDATPMLIALSNIPSGNNTNWDVTLNGAGFSISRHGETFGYLNQRDDAVSGKYVLAFWTHTSAKGDDGSRIFLTEVIPGLGTSTTISQNPSGVVPTSGKVYRIYNSAITGYMISENSLTNNGLVKTNQKTVHDGRQMWVALQTDAANNGFQLVNIQTGRYMQAAEKSAQGITSTKPVTVYLKNTTNNSGYGICEKADGSGSKNLNTNSGINNIVGWSWTADGSSNQGSNWIFEEVDFSDDADYLTSIKAFIKANSPYATLTSGDYYRLVNSAYPTRHLVDNVGSENVSGLEDSALPNLNAQIWQIQGDEAHGYTLQNAFTSHYIKDQSSTSSQFATSTYSAEANKFFLVVSGEADWGVPRYAFRRASNDNRSLHCGKSQGYIVVSWTYTENSSDVLPSFWSLEPVEMDDAKLAEMQAQYAQYMQEKNDATYASTNLADVNAALNSIFTDASCSELRDTYKNLSDYRIGLAIDALGLPETIKQMALRVKHNTWETDKDATYNKYVRDFRIADYEPYSDRHVWKDITNVGPFGQLVNPTGITVKAGDVVYLYVADDVKDSDATIFVELASGTEHTGTTQTLHKGVNTYLAPKAGELFIGYFVSNSDKYVVATANHPADYPNIRVHIEGGEATGMWDMSRKMSNADWAYLSENMFTADYLRVKGKSTVLGLITSKVRGADNVEGIMKIWDFIFEDEERLLGNDGQWDGRYRPVITPRDCNSTINPNWGGNCGTNHPSIDQNGMFNYSTMMGGDNWEILHEEAHAHQYPVNMAGTTESSNNAYAQMVVYDFGTKSSRGVGVAGLIDMFNKGFTWLDIVRAGEGGSRGTPYYNTALWAANHMFYQLFLYFHVQGHKPDFFPRVADWMRDNGGLIQTGKGSYDPPTYYYEDYFKFAEACAEVSQTDLSEFFETWGFFGYNEDVVTTKEDGYNGAAQDHVDDGIRHIGDYGNYNMYMPMKSNDADVARVEGLRNRMKSFTKKAPNIMFLDDRIKDMQVRPDCFAATLDPSVVGKNTTYFPGMQGTQGDYGMFTDFTGTNEANALDYTISGNTVTMSGDGLVGVKIYDGEGNLKYIYNTETFTVPEDVAAALNNGSMTLVAALGDDTNLPLAKPSAQKHKMIVYNGTAEDCQTYFVTGEAAPANVPYSTLTGSTDVPVLSGNAMALLPEDSNYFGLPQGMKDALKNTNVFTKGTANDPEAWQATYVNLTDKQDFYLPEGDYIAGTLTYSRTNTAGLNSVCLPFDAKTSDFGADAKIYEFSLVDGDRISFIEVQKAEAGKFYIVECPAEAPAWNIVMPEATIIGSPTASADAAGAFCGGPVPNGVYKLNASGTKFGITKDGKGTVTAFRGYYNPAAPTGAAHAPAAMPLTLVELGDVNGDGTVSVADVTELVDRLNSTLAASNRRNAAPAQTTPFERQAQRAADVDCDGTLTQADMQFIINRLLKK